MLALERLAPGIGLIVSRAVAGVADEVGQAGLGVGDLLAQAFEIAVQVGRDGGQFPGCLLYTSPSPRD